MRTDTIVREEFDSSLQFISNHHLKNPRCTGICLRMGDAANRGAVVSTSTCYEMRRIGGELPDGNKGR